MIHYVPMIVYNGRLMDLEFKTAMSFVGNAKAM